MIDVSYFVDGPRKIQNATTRPQKSANELSVEKALDGFIRVYENKFMREALGRVAYGEYLKMDEESKKKMQDPLKDAFADYVFYWVLRNANHEATITGVKQLKDANEYVSPMQKMITVWNNMVDKMRDYSEREASNHKNILVSSNLLTPINQFNL